MFLRSKVIKRSLPFVLVLAIFSQGCATKPAITQPKDLAIPADLAKAFEVKELPPATAPAAIQPAVATAVASAPNADESKSKKKKKTKKQKRLEAQGPTGPKIADAQATGFAIPNRRPKFDPVWVGEQIYMDVTWLATKAGEFLLEVLPFKEIEGRKVYDLKGTARTSELFSLVYKAEDWVESYVDYIGWFPYKFILHGDETKHIRNNLELFDHAAKQQYVHIHDNRVEKKEIHEEKGFKDLIPFSQDSLSALYYARTLDLKDGAMVRFPVTANGSQFETEVIVLGHEDVNTRMGYMKSIKTKVQTRFNGVLQQQGDAFMWFSDDEKKYPLRFEAKVKIGWVSGIAKKLVPGVPELPTVAPAPVPASTTAIKDASISTGKSAAPVSGIEKATFSAEEKPKLRPKPKLWFNTLLENSKALEDKK